MGARWVSQKTKRMGLQRNERALEEWMLNAKERDMCYNLLNILGTGSSFFGGQERPANVCPVQIWIGWVVDQSSQPYVFLFTFSVCKAGMDPCTLAGSARQSARRSARSISEEKVTNSNRFGHAFPLLCFIPSPSITDYDGQGQHLFMICTLCEA